MVRRRFSNSIKDCRTYTGADINSDHNLLISKMNFRLKKMEKRKTKEQYDMNMLIQENIQEKYAVSVSNRYSTLVCEEVPQVESEEMRVDRKWKCFKESIHTATRECTSKIERSKHKDWMTEDILQKMEERKELKNTVGSAATEYKVKDKEIRKACLAAKETWFNERCEEILNMEKNHNSKEMHRKVKEVIGNNKKGARPQEWKYTI